MERAPHGGDRQLRPMANEPFLAEFGDRPVRLLRDERNQRRQLLVGDPGRVSAADRIRREIAALSFTPKQTGDGCLADVEDVRNLRVRHIALCISRDNPTAEVQGQRLQLARRSSSVDLRKREPL